MKQQMQPMVNNIDVVEKNIMSSKKDEIINWKEKNNEFNESNQRVNETLVINEICRCFPDL